MIHVLVFWLSGPRRDSGALRRWESAAPSTSLYSCSKFKLWLVAWQKRFFLAYFLVDACSVQLWQSFKNKKHDKLKYLQEWFGLFLNSCIKPTDVFAKWLHLLITFLLKSDVHCLRLDPLVLAHYLLVIFFFLSTVLCQSSTFFFFLHFLGNCFNCLLYRCML